MRSTPDPGRLLFLVLLPILLLVAVLSSPPAAGDGFRGRVVGVSSGDRLTVLQGERPREVRLAGMAAPEAGDPFSQRSKQNLADLAHGRPVTVLPKVEEPGRPTVAQVLVETEGGPVLDLAQEQLRAGMGWYAGGRGIEGRGLTDPALAAAQEEARQAKRGLWSVGFLQPPWEGREESTAGDDGTAPYHGNVRSRKFHRPSCRYYHCTNCTVILHDRQDAIRSGFTPCGICEP